MLVDHDDALVDSGTVLEAVDLDGTLGSVVLGDELVEELVGLDLFALEGLDALVDLRTFHDLDLDLVGLVLRLRSLALDLMVLEGLGALADLLDRGTFPDEHEVDGLEMSLVGLEVGEVVGLELFVGLAVEEMVR